MSYKSTDANLREGLFRFGRPVNLENFKFSYYRDWFSHLYCSRVVDQALKKGWDMVKPDTDDKLQISDKVFKHLRPNLPEVLQSYKFARRDGKALLLALQSDNELRFVAVPRAHYHCMYDKNEKIISGWFIIKIENSTEMQQIDIMKIPENRRREIMFARKDTLKEGMSVLEPAWDIIFAIYMVLSHSAYNMARAGAGLKRLTVDEALLSKTGNSDLISELVTNASHFGSAHDVLVTLKSIGGHEIEFDHETADIRIDYDKFMNMYCGALAGLTGIPAAILRGMFEGEPETNVTALEGWNDVLRDFQFDADPHNRWVTEITNEFYMLSRTSNIPDYDLLHRESKIMSKSDEIALLRRQLENAELFQNLGMDKIKAFEKAGIKGITEMDMAEVEPLIGNPNGNPNLLDPEHAHGQNRPNAGLPRTRDPYKVENNSQLV